MVKEVNNMCLSHEAGYRKATSFSTLGHAFSVAGFVMYEVVGELRYTIRTLQERIAAQDAIINEFNNCGGGGDSGALSFADIVKCKKTIAFTAGVALLANETKQHND
jgi:hypothetical protein